MSLFGVLNLIMALTYVVSKRSFLRLISWLYFFVVISFNLLNSGHTWLVSAVMFLAITSFILTEFFSISSEPLNLKKKEESSWNKSKTILATVSMILFACMIIFIQQNNFVSNIDFTFNDSFSMNLNFGFQEAVLITTPLLLLTYKVKKLLDS